MILRSLVGTAIVAAVVGQAPTQSPMTPTDSAIINEALRATAMQEIARFDKAPYPPAALYLVKQSVASCGVTPPKTFCLDSAFKTLDVVRQRGGWPAAPLVAELQERNKTSVSLAHLQLATGTLVDRGERASMRDGRSVAQVSLPAIEGDAALIIVVAQFAGSQAWAVQLGRAGGTWRATRVGHLLSGG
jgi:hypothetical protein